MDARLTVNLEKISRLTNNSLYFLLVTCFFLGLKVSFYFHFLTVTIFLLLTLINAIHYLYFQKQHALLSNFGLLAQMRYMMESIGPEFRQYLYMSDTEEKPFNRIERSEVYRKAKNVDSSSAFGSLNQFNHREIKLRHSLYPKSKEDLKGFHLDFWRRKGYFPTPLVSTNPL